MFFRYRFVYISYAIAEEETYSLFLEQGGNETVTGHISVKIQTNRENTKFSIENDSEPLSGEALSKVWDTFYRTDQARSGGGSGLGLAIAKNIIELHGGKCSVRNTDHGVEFGFTLPN